MLGLRIALSVAKKTLGDLIDGLLSTLRGRATYYENGSASKSTIKAIDNADVLDKATILLTPTATSDALVHSVKDNTSDSDFDFDRASSATRINSSGLVQDMQSITDPELVLNGDFEELGDEEVTNGTFATDSDWTKLNATISGGKGNLDGNGQTSMLWQDILTDGKTYKATFTVSDYNGSGQARIINSNGDTYYTITENGTFTVYFKHIFADGLFYFRAISGAVFSIDNVSVQQVDPNDRWTLGTGWSIEDGVLQLTGTETTNANQAIGLVEDNIYQVTFTVSETTSGAARVRLGTGTISNDFTDGTHTITLEHTTSNDALRFYADSSGVFNGKIDNVSVKDITFSTDVDLARINYDSNGENGHILLEPTSTNFLPYSNDFSQSNWVKQTNITPTYNTTETLSPDGTYNATKLVGNGTDGIYDSSLSITGDVTRSVYLKSVSGTINVKLKDSNVDIGTETLTVTTEWQRFYLSGDNGTSSQGIWIDDIPLSGVYIFGAQVENLPYATSYIPSLTGSTVTRAAETLTGSGNSTLINSTEGVLYAEIAALVNSGLVRYLGLSDGSNNNRVVILNDGTANRIRAIVSSGGTKYADLFYNVTDVTDFHKVAVKYKANDFALWIDGVERATDTSGSAPIGLNDLEFDLNTGGAFYGKCKALAVFDRALNDTELGNLTNNS